VSYAETALADTNVVCYLTGGNDDHQEVLAFAETDHVRNPDNKVVNISDKHEMANLGWSNPTPWKTPRECSEEELEKRINDMVHQIRDMPNALFNFHIPPINSSLDTCPMLDDSVNPPKPVFRGGQQVLMGGGSSAVRHSVEHYQPLLVVSGHIHESRGLIKIGRTTCVNPGSEYGEGILRGVILNIGDGKLVSYQFTSG
jgi:hypothetical protein